MDGTTRTNGTSAEQPGDAGGVTLGVLAWEGGPAGQGSAGSAWRPSGPVTERGTTRAAVFAFASDALLAARWLVRGAGRPAQEEAGSGPARALIHVGEAPAAVEEALREGGLPPLIEAAMAELAGVPAGCVVCTEAAAAVLRQARHGAVLTPLRRLGCPTGWFRALWFHEEGAPEPAAERIAGLAERETALVGRDAELAALRALVLEQGARLVTITGVAGSGKTRLADAFVHAAAAAWPGPIGRVSLSAVEHAALLPDAVLRSLGVSPADAVAEHARLVEVLAGRPALLVLDTLEHLGAAGAEQVWTLLEAVPGLTCVCTSRSPLGLSGEQVLQLGPLAVPAADMGPAELLAVDSVRLYLDRVAQVAPELDLTAELGTVVSRLVARLEGLPLAIELAAACCRSMSPAMLLARWDERLDLLADETAPDRHRTLRVALAWSHDLLPARVRRLLAWLSVFRGGWSLDAAAAVGGEPDALELLEELREASLVEVLDDGTEMRFRMLETVREYAAQKLAERGEEPAAREAHRRYFRDLAEQGATRLEREGEQRAWLVRFDTELENLRAALTSAGAASAAEGLAFAGLLWRYWLVRGGWAEGTSWLERGLAAPGLAAAERARALAWLGHLRFRQGLYEGASEALDEALALGEAAADRAGIAHALNELGKVHWGRGEYGPARQCYQRSLDLRRADGNVWGVAASLGNLGAVAAATGDTAGAAAYLEEGLACRRQLGDRRGVAASLNNLGALAYNEGRYLAAEGHLTESLDIRQELDDQPGVATVLNDLGALGHSRGQLDEAVRFYERSLAIRRDIGDRRGVAVTLANLGAVTRDRGDLQAACRCCEESASLHREMGDRRGLARTLTSLGDLLAGGGDRASAARCHEEALAIQIDIGDQRGAALSLSNLGEVATVEQRYADAEGLYGRAAAMAAEVRDAWLSCIVEQGNGRLRAAQHREREAAASYLECLTIRLGLGEQRGLPALLDDIAAVRTAMHAPEDAARWLGAAEAERERMALRRSADAQGAFERLAGGLAERLGAERLTALAAEGRVAALTDLQRALAGAIQSA